jgi:hypothetical protein
MKLDLDTVVRKLSDWKEKILFVVVVLLTANVATNASPLGGGIDRIEAEARQDALSKAKIEEGMAQKVREKLIAPGDVSPTRVDSEEFQKEVLSLFYDERDVFPRAGKRKPSGWMLGQDNFEKLPPLPLVVPGTAPLADFDLPAGPVPELSRARGMVPRDPRTVILAAPDTSEFKD